MNIVVGYMTQKQTQPFQFMPNPTERPSLTKTLDQRYATQHAGGAFEVKQRLGAPGAAPNARMPVDGNEVLYTIDDFKTKAVQGITELKDALEANTSPSPKSKEMSRFMRGFSNKRYKP